MDSVEQLNSHLKVLKQALLQEKEKKKENFKLAEVVKGQIRDLDEQGREIDLILEKKAKEVEFVEDEVRKALDQLKIAKAKNNPLKKSFGTNKSMIALQAQNEKLIEEYTILHSEHKQDGGYINKLKEEYTQYQREIKLTNAEIQKINENCSDEQEKFLKITKKIREEVEEIVGQKVKIIEKNAEISEELEKIQRKNQRLQQDLNNLNQFIDSKKEVHERLLESVEVHEKNEKKLALMLIEAKSELLDANTFYQEFHVRVLSFLIPFAGKLVFKKNQEDEYVVELMHKGKIDYFSVKDIDDLSEHPCKENRIILSYCGKSREILTDEKHKIVPRLRELMQRCIKNE